VTAAARVLEYNVLVYKKTWHGSLFTTFFAPILFLASMGIGLGGFIDQSGSAALGGVPYAVFLAPGLLVAQAMQTGSFESTYPIMGNLVWDRVYHGMLATPITVGGIILGQLAWMTVRLTIVASAFFLVMVLFGVVDSPLGVLGIGAAVLTGLAFAAPIMAFAATQRNDTAFSAIFRFLITPLFIFSGTFFPITQLPPFLRWIAYLTPTWHGVNLARTLSLGIVDPLLMIVNIAFLVGCIAGGIAACFITFRRVLVK
jgi:lipooligosaccharide transport system permease protein